MQVKLEVESSRVKGVSFHPNRPWVLYSTHTGTVHLHDYEVGVELSRFSVTKDQPVRCVSFHPTQPLFACGTDGHDVIIYNWQRRMRLFTLTGHFDFVRSVEFHPTQPLLISSSDDSAARIWNWQSRCCIAVLDEHTYFVMCARFNTSRNLVATACMDDCVRIFNVNALFQSSMSKDVDASFFSMDNTSTMTSELEEHPDGANFVAWNQLGNKLVSCGEDKTIKIFSMLGDEATLMRTLNAHSGSVTCVNFHWPTGNLVSVSEDGTLCVFDGNSYRQINKHEIAGTRFWCCACHPKDALLVAGHDRGIVLLKFAKERPPYDVQGNSVLWLQEKELHVIDVISKAQDRPIPAHEGARSVAWNTARNLVLVSYVADDGEHCDLVEMGKPSPVVTLEGTSAVWLSRGSAATLSTSKDKLLVSEIGGSSVRSVSIPRCSRIFSATTQRVFLASRTSLILFDVPRSQVISEVKFGDAKLLVFDEQKERICSRNSSSILTAHADLSQFNVFNESCKIKSCCWWGSAVLYTTRNHLKYIVSGNNGVVCSLPRVLYLIKSSGDTAWFVTRDGVLFKREIEMSEVRLKAALSQNKSDDVARRIIAENRPIGFSIMEFAAQNQRFEIAAALAEDPQKRFEMTVRAGDLQAAAAVADEIDDKAIYKQLSQAALEVGRFTLAETALRKAEDFDNLAFLYVLSGETEKLHRLAKQTSSLLHQLWVNDDESISRVLTSVSPTLEVESNALRVELGRSVLSDWPMTRSGMIHTTIESIPEDEDAAAAWLDAQEEEEEQGGAGNWGIDIDDTIDDVDLRKATKQFVPPPRGSFIHQQWTERAQTAGERVAAGNFGEALAFLRETVAVRNVEPLRDLFIETFTGANAAICGFGGLFPVPVSLSSRSGLLPALPNSLDLFEVMVKSMFLFFQKAKFAECRSACLEIIRRVLVATVSTRDKERKVIETLDVARNYCLAVSIEMKRQTEANTTRKIELAVYLTHVRLEAVHLHLVLQLAMKVAIEKKNYLTAKSIITRFLDLSPPIKQAELAQRKLAQVQANATNAVQIDYDDRIAFSICGMSMKPIYRGKASITCPFCGAVYLPQFKGKLCAICEISEIGGAATGLKLVRSFR
jgi:coatomer protein complex subunit alpha (xenin)